MRKRESSTVVSSTHNGISGATSVDGTGLDVEIRYLGNIQLSHPVHTIVYTHVGR